MSLWRERSTLSSSCVRRAKISFATEKPPRITPMHTEICRGPRSEFVASARRPAAAASARSMRARIPNASAIAGADRRPAAATDVGMNSGGSLSFIATRCASLLIFAVVWLLAPWPTMCSHYELAAIGAWTTARARASGATTGSARWSRAERRGDRGFDSPAALRCGPRSNSEHTPAF